MNKLCTLLTLCSINLLDQSQCLCVRVQSAVSSCNEESKVRQLTYVIEAHRFLRPESTAQSPFPKRVVCRLPSRNYRVCKLGLNGPMRLRV
jgi:hypothetical protein